jgi:hypothetical protein
MSYATRGSGGGGGFGGFPYRSSHQQGNDNSTNTNNNNNNSNGNNNNDSRARRNRSNKVANRRKRGGPVTCQAKLQIPPPYRKFIVGTKGATIRALTEGTRCIINVPGKRQIDNERAMVEIKASCVDFLLHGCWEVLNIVTNRQHLEDDTLSHVDESTNITMEEGVNLKMEMNYILNVGGLSFRGTSIHHNDIFMAGAIPHAGYDQNQNKGNTIETCSSNYEISAYCIEITDGTIEEDGISVLVDNERFVDPGITAEVAVIGRSPEMIKSLYHIDDVEGFNEDIRGSAKIQGNLLVFMYGSQQDKTRILYENMLQKYREL